jgi:hypothetical protein
VVILQRQAELFQIVLALRAPGRFTRLLHGRKQQGHQHSDDGDDDQQFDQREAATRILPFSGGLHRLASCG